MSNDYTLKMHQNRLTKIMGKIEPIVLLLDHLFFFLSLLVQGIEKMKLIEELDLSENYITSVPQEIRALINLEKVET